jgi:hypothetical protein
MNARDYMLTEWSNVPMMPSDKLFESAWFNLVGRAVDKYGHDAVQAAIKSDTKLGKLHDAWGDAVTK